MYNYMRYIIYKYANKIKIANLKTEINIYT